MASPKRRSGFRVIAVDRPGFASGEGQPVLASRAAAFAWAEDFMRQHRPQPASFTSYGQQQAPYVLIERLYASGDHTTLAHWHGNTGKWVPVARANPSSTPQNVWRRRQIIMEPELVERVSEWHGGQSTPTYALASWGLHHFVSLSMIDAALRELKRTRARERQADARMTSEDRRSLRDLIGDLETLRTYWKESSAHEAGASQDDDGYDPTDHGFSPAEEAEFDVRSR